MAKRYTKPKPNGRQPLTENEVAQGVTIKAPKGFWVTARERSSELGFAYLAEFVRYCIQQELFKKHDRKLIRELNQYKRENIELREKRKGRSRKEPDDDVA